MIPIYNSLGKFIGHLLTEEEAKLMGNKKDFAGAEKEMKNALNSQAAQQQSPLQHQQGGSHYLNLAIQPIEYITKNNLDFCQGNVVKYVTRFRSKGGIQDLKKAKHFIDLLIMYEEEKMNLGASANAEDQSISSYQQSVAANQKAL